MARKKTAMSEYRSVLAAADKAGSCHATDAGVMAQYCERILQIMVGAASPELVWTGAQKRGMTTMELAALAVNKPADVHELMWV